jgi:hypothetical protein
MNINEVERVLAAEPRNVRALILKADYLANAGDARAASSFYMAALKAAGPPQQVARELLPDLQRARSMYERYASQYQDYIVDQLRAHGFDPATSSPRFAQSLDIVLGKKQIYLQQPRYYYFPGLPQIQFYGASSSRGWQRSSARPTPSPPNCKRSCSSRAPLRRTCRAIASVRRTSRKGC